MHGAHPSELARPTRFENLDLIPSKPDLAGSYFYSDVCKNFVETIDIVGGAATNQQVRTADATSTGISLGAVASFAEDARGELYIVDLAGAVYRIVHD